MDIRRVYKSLNSIQQYLFPGQCLLCLDPAPSGHQLCVACIQDLPHNPCTCGRCGKPLPISVSLCGDCQKSPPPYDSIRTLYRYEPPVDRLIQQMKYNGKLHLARLFGAQLALAVPGWIRDTGRPDLVVPVPLHPSRLRQRGFNQSIEIARQATTLLGARLELDKVNRTRKTRPQTELPLEKRRTNIRGAFALDARLDGLSVVIVDDVITSGHTVGELAQALKQGGAERVDVWGIARA